MPLEMPSPPSSAGLAERLLNFLMVELTGFEPAPHGLAEPLTKLSPVCYQLHHNPTENIIADLVDFSFSVDFRSTSATLRLERSRSMATSLTKKAFLPLETAIPIPVMTDTLLYHEEIKCPLCPQEYSLGYSDGEQFRLDRWRERATSAVSRSHQDGHELMALSLPGIP